MASAPELGSNLFSLSETVAASLTVVLFGNWLVGDNGIGRNLTVGQLELMFQLAAVAT